MEPSDIRILHGLRQEHREAFVQLFCDTFQEVIVPVFGSVERCALLLEDSLEANRVLAAISGNRLIGFACLNYSGREWFDPGLRQLLGVLRMGIIRVMVMGIILFKRPKSDVLHLDTLAVHVDMRGQGIGTQLIGAVVALAQAEDKERVILEVEDINPRAKQLYERLGFSTAKFEKLLWPWSRAFAFSGSYCMAKNVARAELRQAGDRQAS